MVGFIWVFKIKSQIDGSIERYKDCLVAKYFMQVYNIHYENTLFRLLASHPFTFSWILFQMDVKNVFLNGNLSKEVYM